MLIITPCLRFKSSQCCCNPCQEQEKINNVKRWKLYISRHCTSKQLARQLVFLQKSSWMPPGICGLLQFSQNPLGHRQIHAQDNSSSYDSLGSMFTKTCHLFLVGLAVSHTLGKFASSAINRIRKHWPFTVTFWSHGIILLDINKYCFSMSLVVLICSIPNLLRLWYNTCVYHSKVLWDNENKMPRVSSFTSFAFLFIPQIIEQKRDHSQSIIKQLTTAQILNLSYIHHELSDVFYI